jgi:TolB-like protein/lipoprotein NlpI
MAIWSAEIKELERLHEALKGQLPDMDKELGQLIKSDDPNVILLYSRRCLEVIITDLCECELKRSRGTEPLKGIIDKLFKEKKVPDYITTSMHGLNDLSTYGTHPKDFDPKQVKPVLNNLDIIIRWYLMYKGLGEGITVETGEEQVQEIKTLTGESRRTLIKKNKKFLIRAGIILAVLIIIAIVYFTNILSGGNFTKGLEKSIAVLPFRNDSPSDSNQYFIDGFMVDVLNHLQTIKDLIPISRTSVERYRKTTKSILEIAKELRVNYIVEGDMQRYGNSTRLSVNLFKARKKELKLWGKTYEQEIHDAKDVFKIQSQIAESIAAELEAVITPQEKRLIEKTPTSTLAAYENYNLGMNYLGRFTKEDFDIALQYFEKAKETDPEYALAYVGIASVWINRAINSYATPGEAAPIAKANLAKAFELDSTRSEVYYSLGLDQIFIDYDFKGAETSLKKCISLNPNNSLGFSTYGMLLVILGRPKEALEQHEIALKLDPMNMVVKADYGFTMYCAGIYNEAIKLLQEVLKIDPGNVIALDILPLVLHDAARYSEELEAWKVDYNIAFKGYANVFDQGYINGGLTGALNLQADSLVKKSNTKFISPCEIAQIYACAGNKERTLGMLERAYVVHDAGLPLMLRLPVYEFIHNEPRYQNLFHKINLQYKL